MTRTAALFAAFVLFFWMFLAADPLEQLGAADRFNPGRPDVQELALSYAALWRHGMAGNSPLVHARISCRRRCRLVVDARKAAVAHVHRGRCSHVLGDRRGDSARDSRRRPRYRIVRATVRPSARRSRSTPVDVVSHRRSVNTCHLDDRCHLLPAGARAPSVRPLWPIPLMTIGLVAIRAWSWTLCKESGRAVMERRPGGGRDSASHSDCRSLDVADRAHLVHTARSGSRTIRAR